MDYFQSIGLSYFQKDETNSKSYLTLAIHLFKAISLLIVKSLETICVIQFWVLVDEKDNRVILSEKQVR